MAQWKSSGLSIRGFCARQSISEANFHAWRRELAKRDAEQTSTSHSVQRRSAEKSSLSLVPLRVVGDAMIEVVWPNGLLVRVPNVKAAAELIAALESPTC